jgi:dTDP-4-dehydrorhamnose 3,5-epimerase
MSVVEFATQHTDIDGLVVVTMKQVTDERGTVRELFRRSTLAAVGVDLERIEQINVTETLRKGAVRGMHAEAMTKLVAVAHGRAHGMYVDARRHSSTFGAVVDVPLAPGTQVFVPSGVANGFQALADATQYAYCFDTEWSPGMAGFGFTPLDPIVASRWPLPIDADDRSQLSLKDLQAPGFHEVLPT